MELSQQSAEEKKLKSSFWNRLLRLPRKSHHKEKHDDSFRRQSVQYSSLSATKQEAKRSSTSDESANFTIMECSAFMDVHRDAGILFLNKDSVTTCFAPKEENKHVQFAPTPMNKYYKVDVKAAPSKKQNDENKENLDQKKSVKPTRPILRLDKCHKIGYYSSSEDTRSNKETRLVNVTYVEGPEVKTPSIPRTSTKIALVDRKNGSLQQLNVSSIVKYNSLPRHPKNMEEQTYREQLQVTQSTNMKSTESIQSQLKHIRPVADIDMHRKSMRNLNTHRQSCYGVSDPSRIFEGRKVLQSQNNTYNQDTRQRLSLGGPLIPSSHMNIDLNPCVETISQTSYLNPKSQNNFKKFIRAPVRSQSYARSLDQPIHPVPKQDFLFERNINKLNRQLHHASTGQIPNKAINEVGLPLVTNKRNKQLSTTRSTSRSISPQYIPLCETFTKTKNGTKWKGNSLPQNSKYLSDPPHTAESSNRIALHKSKQGFCSSAVVDGKGKKLKNNVLNAEQEQNEFICEARKQAIKSAMQTQKQKIVNKICKYNSKQCEDGFSSMADDECSFNCSCQSCVTKLSRSYKRNGFKKLFSSNKNKYFFTIEPDIKEGNEMERLPENQTFEGPMARAQPHLSNKANFETVANRTWYECNDTLCQTPRKKSAGSNSLELVKTPTNKLVDNIYENLTQIINSATKCNLKPQDVKNILSTPISSPANLKIITSLKKTPQRVLFPDESHEQHKTLDLILSPVRESDCFNDSIVLLQEIFQKLSYECRELLQPNASTQISSGEASDLSQNSLITTSNRYVNDLVKNLKSTKISEADFATIIGGIAQNIFSETKAKRKRRFLAHSTSLPDLQKNESFLSETIGVAHSLKDLSHLQIKDSKMGTSAKLNTSQSTNETRGNSAFSGDSVRGNRQLPDGWSRTPTSECSIEASNDPSSTKLSSSGTENDTSKYSENELRLLENAIRLGMGLSPMSKVKKTPMFAASPTKATKYKSKDVLSGKGKLKLKIYNNSGLVTVYVMKAAKLCWANGRELNSYVKITMIPDESKRVHWRTAVQKAQKNPVFNQKFSFELLEDDETKRLVFSVWHRDYAKQRSELIGCMSFSVRHVMDNTHNVDGWYRLLRERFGTQKHFAAHTRKNSCSFKSPTK